MNTNQLSLALANRDRGLRRVTAANATFVETWRAEARRIARNRADHTITADDLREHAVVHPGLPTPTHFNAWGAVFSRNPDFEFAGYTKSRQPQGHNNLIRRWRLKGAA